MSTRDELVQVVENAKDTYNAFWDVKDAGAASVGLSYRDLEVMVKKLQAVTAAWDAYMAAKIALKAYDKEKNT